MVAVGLLLELTSKAFWFLGVSHHPIQSVTPRRDRNPSLPGSIRIALRAKYITRRYTTLYYIAKVTVYSLWKDAVKVAVLYKGRLMS